MQLELSTRCALLELSVRGHLRLFIVGVALSFLSLLLLAARPHRMEQLIQRNLFLLSNSLKYPRLGHFTFLPFIPFIFVLRRPYGFDADFLLAGVRRVPALLSIDLAQLHG